MKKNIFSTLFLSLLFLSSLFGADADYFKLDKKHFRAMSEYFENHTQNLYFMKLYISSDFSVDIGDEVGVFVNDVNNNEYGILIGSYKIESNDIRDSKANEIDIVCFESSNSDINSKDGAFNGDRLYYKFYDKSEGKIYKALSSSDITFSKGGLVSPSFKNTSISLSGELEEITPLSLSIYSKNFILGSSSYDVLITGGVAPYSLNSVNIVNAVISNNILTITPISVGNDKIIVTDSLSNSKEIDISISAEAFSVSDNNIELNLSAPNSTEITINGGVKPYIITNISNSNIVNANLNGDKLTITSTAVGSTFLTIGDSISNSQTVAVSVADNSNNIAPVISSITFSSNEVLENESIDIEVISSDSDGDLLTTTCSAEEGTITESNGNFTFKAPFINSDKDIEITCFSSDSKTTTSKVATIRVKNIVTNSTQNNGTNYPPTISQIYTGFDEIIENSSISVLIIADDLNGDDLTYSCQSDIGVIESLSENSVKFLSPNLDENRDATISCSVSDGTTTVNKSTILKIKDIQNSTTTSPTNQTDSTVTDNNSNIDNNSNLDIIFNIKSGWNLIGNSSNREIDKKFFEDTFSKDMLMHSFINNSWFNFSNQDKINILPKQGFWIKSDSLIDYNLTINKSGDGTAEFFTPKSGWNLMATMSRDTLINTKNLNNASKIWRYENISKSWLNAVDNPNEVLEVGYGYWIFLP